MGHLSWYVKFTCNNYFKKTGEQGAVTPKIKRSVTYSGSS